MTNPLASALGTTVDEIKDNSTRLGLTWQLRPGTAEGIVEGGLTQVLVDNDTTMSQAVSLIGPPGTGARVMIMFVPPSGAYIVGYTGTNPHIPGAVIAMGEDNVSQATTTTTEVKDTGIGDVTFIALSGRLYTIEYNVRVESDTAVSTMDIRVRDGNASSPNNGSTLLVGASHGFAQAGGPGATQLSANRTLVCPGDIAEGTHVLAGFYARTAGGGNVTVSQASGQLRQLKVTCAGGNLVV